LSYAKDFEELVLIGHSLGTVAIQKYLSEHKINEEFGLDLLQVHFVGCCVEEGNFKVDDNWTSVQEQSKNIYIYHSFDDPVCPFDEGEYYSKNQPDALFIKFENYGHFEMEHLPELIENIVND
jgi:predicted alpha/beta hydrolase family esterase